MCCGEGGVIRTWRPVDKPRKGTQSEEELRARRAVEGVNGRGVGEHTEQPTF